MPVQALPAFMPYALTAGIGLLYYRRVRRSFGRQPWQPRRTMARVALLTLVLVPLMIAALLMPGGWMAGAGLAAGIGLGATGVTYTRIEAIDGVRSYVPNPWIGGALSVLLIGRLAWRLIHGGFVQRPPGDASPLTLTLAAALIGYYLTYSVALMLRMRRLSQPAES